MRRHHRRRSAAGAARWSQRGRVHAAVLHQPRRNHRGRRCAARQRGRAGRGPLRCWYRAHHAQCGAREARFQGRRAVQAQCQQAARQRRSRSLQGSDGPRQRDIAERCRSRAAEQDDAHRRGESDRQGCRTQERLLGTEQDHSGPPLKGARLQTARRHRRARRPRAPGIAGGRTDPRALDGRIRCSFPVDYRDCRARSRSGSAKPETR
ncbi:unannotated protein [freshwater metagenome]|uniref:Unannotated protein n=1 Tax=freshwater metagenome TaxID=449393 RepID=A0A6J7QQA3_9ZZZZ